MDSLYSELEDATEFGLSGSARFYILPSTAMPVIVSEDFLHISAMSANCASLEDIIDASSVLPYDGQVAELVITMEALRDHCIGGLHHFGIPSSCSVGKRITLHCPDLDRIEQLLIHEWAHIVWESQPLITGLFKQACVVEPSSADGRVPALPEEQWASDISESIFFSTKNAFQTYLDRYPVRGLVFARLLSGMIERNSFLYPESESSKEQMKHRLRDLNGVVAGGIASLRTFCVLQSDGPDKHSALELLNALQ